MPEDPFNSHSLDSIASRLNADFKLLSPETQQRILDLRKQTPSVPPKLQRDR